MRTFMLELFVKRDGMFVVIHRSEDGCTESGRTQRTFMDDVTPATAHRIIKRAQGSATIKGAAVWEYWR